MLDDATEMNSGGPPVVGVETRRRRRLRYELLGCALRGHPIVGAQQADQSGHADLLVRPDDNHRGVDWYRCMRCDAWLPMTDSAQLDDPADRRTPPAGPVNIPLRGRPLRDRFVLRLIAVDRVIHFLLIGAVGVAIFLFANHRDQLKGNYTRILNRLQAAFGGPLTDSPTGLLHDLDRLFAVPTGKLYLYGAAIALYAIVNGVEAVGLWRRPALGRIPDPGRDGSVRPHRNPRTVRPRLRAENPYAAAEPRRPRVSVVRAPPPSASGAAAAPTKPKKTATPAGPHCNAPLRGSPQQPAGDSPK